MLTPTPTPSPSVDIITPGFPDENSNDIDDRLEQAPCTVDCVEDVQLPMPAPLRDELALTGPTEGLALVPLLLIAVGMAAINARRRARGGRR
ncbi:hypothetical protein [Microcella sp.]|uniref:hypothetical protein n=1 Tax=Microcella sp. TaxID=1913979 RepID=UPI00391DFF1E